MKLSAVKIDSARLETGAWVGDIPEMGDLRLQVRGLSNEDAVKLRGKLVDAVPKAQKMNGRVDPDIAEDITTRVLAETVLLGWDGLTDDDDVAIPFTAAKALEILSDPDMAMFKGAVLYAAGTLAEAKGEALETDMGNSAKPSLGASNGETAATS